MSGRLPKTWAAVRLGDIAEVQLGKMLSAKAKAGRAPRPYLRNINIRWGHIDTQDVLQMDFDAREVEKYALQDGDVLVCEGGEPGRAAVWRSQLPGALYQKALHRVRFRDGSLDPKLFVYQLELDAAVGTLARRFTGSMIKHLPREVFLDYQVRVPPRAEQRRIIAVLEENLSDLDAAAAGLRRALLNAHRYRDAIRAAAVDGTLVADTAGATSFLHDGQNDGLPTGWRWATIAECAANEANSITDGPFGSKLKTAHYADSGPRVIRLQNIGDGGFIDARAHIPWDHFETLRKHEIFAGDVVIAALGEALPRACIIPEQVGPAIVKADCIRFRPNPELLLPAYATIALNAETTRKRVTAMVHGVGRPRLNLSEIKSIAIALPPVDQQHAIISEVERRLAVADRTAAEIDIQLARAARLRQSILKRAFEGKLVPQDPHDEPASALVERIRAERTVSNAKQNGSRSRRTARAKARRARPTRRS